MKDKKKKIAAALAAVGLYLEQEEAAIHQQPLLTRPNGGVDFSPWGYSGRQEMMAMRRLIQLRTFTRL